MNTLELQNSLKGDIKRYTLFKKFKGFTKNGEGMYYVTLLYVTDDYMLIDKTYEIIDLFKVNKKGETIASANTLSAINYYLQDLKQFRA